jgi:hypothetical protein
VYSNNLDTLDELKQSTQEAIITSAEVSELKVASILPRNFKLVYGHETF